MLWLASLLRIPAGKLAGPSSPQIDKDMNIISVLDTISTATFMAALILTMRIGPQLLSHSSRRLLVLALSTCVLVGLSNVLEHGGITDYFDLYEDYVEMLFLPIFVAFGYSVVVSQEVRKREITEAAFQESKSPLYRSLVENIDLGVTLIDNEGTIIMANAAQGRFFERSPGSWWARNVFKNSKEEIISVSTVPEENLWPAANRRK